VTLPPTIYTEMMQMRYELSRLHAMYGRIYKLAENMDLDKVRESMARNIGVMTKNLNAVKGPLDGTKSVATFIVKNDCPFEIQFLCADINVSAAAGKDFRLQMKIKDTWSNPLRASAPGTSHLHMPAGPTRCILSGDSIEIEVYVTSPSMNAGVYASFITLESLQFENMCVMPQVIGPSVVIDGK